MTKPKRPVGRPRKGAVKPVSAEKQTISNSDVSGAKSNPFSSVFAADPIFQNIERQLQFDERPRVCSSNEEFCLCS